MSVKYCALITEFIGNMGAPNNVCASSSVRLALAVATFVFGLLEGGISCWKSRVDRLIAFGKEQSPDP